VTRLVTFDDVRSMFGRTPARVDDTAAGQRTA
jgi:hypothetical protein